MGGLIHVSERQPLRGPRQSGQHADKAVCSALFSGQPSTEGITGASPHLACNSSCNCTG